MRPRVSVVLAAHNEGENLVRTVRAFRGRLEPEDEIIVVDDQSTDDCAAFLKHGADGAAQLLHPRRRLGAPAARNYGARRASGDMIVWSDAHVEPDPGWVEPLWEVLQRPNVALVAPAICNMENRDSRACGRSWQPHTPELRWLWLPKTGDEPYPIPLVPGGFVALTRHTFSLTGGFDEGMLMWGEEGSELSLRMWTMGLQCLVVPTVDILHQFRPRHTFPMNWEYWIHNRLRMGALHFNQARFATLVAALAKREPFPRALSRLVNSDVWKRRDRIRALRVRDDDWFFSNFNVKAFDPAPVVAK
jgi:GT2 family glycosyltransferase